MIEPKLRVRAGLKGGSAVPSGKFQRFSVKSLISTVGGWQRKSLALPEKSAITFPCSRHNRAEPPEGGWIGAKRTWPNWPASLYLRFAISRRVAASRFRTTWMPCAAPSKHMASDRWLTGRGTPGSQSQTPAGSGLKQRDRERARKPPTPHDVSDRALRYLKDDSRLHLGVPEHLHEVMGITGKQERCPQTLARRKGQFGLLWFNECLNSWGRRATIRPG